MRSGAKSPRGVSRQVSLPVAHQRSIDSDVAVVPQSRERLVAAASRCFLNGSFNSVGTAELCASASVHKGTFYHFFPSKTDLLLEVIERRVVDVEKRIAILAESPVHPTRKIIELFLLADATGADAESEAERARDATPPGFFLGNLILELAFNNPPVQEAAEAALRRWTVAIEVIVREFLAAEGITTLDPHGAAEAILGLLQGGAVLASGYRDPRKLRAFGHIAVSLLRTAAVAD